MVGITFDLLGSLTIWSNKSRASDTWVLKNTSSAELSENIFFHSGVVQIQGI